jgi:predicted enzyme related to lactoylglutathione lyase
MERITHFEIPVNDTEKATKFYEAVFGWKFNQWGNEEYYLAETGPNDKPGINGAIMKRKDPAQPVVNSINVKDINKSIETIQANGGTIVVPKMPIPGMGWLAYFKDLDGNIHGIMQDDTSAK